jgi:trehalose 6-phosphate synthase
MSARSARILVASNRGPVSYTLEDDGTVTSKRGGGGLVAGLSAASSATEVVWVCAALSEADRTASRKAPGGRLTLEGDHEGVVRMLPIDALTFHRAYNAVANSTLWFLHHLLYDTPFQPDFNETFRKDWHAYEAYNRAFADALAEEAAEGAKVVVQDYHLTMTPALLRARRPDVRIGHFSHTPWAPPDYFRMLPGDVAVQVLEGTLGADHAGFLTARWARAFAECCADVLDAKVDRDAMTVEHLGRVTRLGVHALGADGEFLRHRASQPDVELRRAVLKEQVGDRKLLLRVDRTELSKNIVRGLRAYRDLLRRYPQWRGNVVHIAFAYPSRHDLPEYREYTAAVQRIGTEIEEEFGSEDWQPVILAVDDDFARSLAAYRLADVLLVNPLRDGMNLVAKEVPVVSERGCTLVLSREAGAFEELGDDAIGINPYDVNGTADALHQALSMDEREREERTKRLAAAATALPPVRWFADQLAALDPPPHTPP